MTLLNTANNIYLGSAHADAVYAGVNKVWPPDTSVTVTISASRAGLGSVIIIEDHTGKTQLV